MIIPTWRTGLHEIIFGFKTHCYQYHYHFILIFRAYLDSYGRLRMCNPPTPAPLVDATSRVEQVLMPSHFRAEPSTLPAHKLLA